MLSALIDDKRRESLMIFPETLKKAMRSGGLYWPLIEFRFALQESRWRRKVRRWIFLQRQQETRIHASLEFLGKRPPFDDLNIGPRCYFEQQISIWCALEPDASPQITLKSDVYLGRNTFIGAFYPITIGRDVMVGAYTYMTSGNHTFERRDIPMTKQPYRGGAITIEDDVWIGSHVVVLPGVTISQGAVIAAGSVVNKSVPPYEIWGGAPARFLKKRPD